MIAGTAGRLAVVSSSSFNLGDAIQTEAARRLIPEDRFGGYVDRDWDERSEWPLLINGWWNHGIRPFLPGSVVLGAHVHPDGLRDFVSSVMGGGPETVVGCRDEFTAEALRSLGLKAFFSGCLTLLLERPEVPRTELVAFVDAPKFHPVHGTLWKRLPAGLKSASLHLTHGRYRSYTVAAVNWTLPVVRKTSADLDHDRLDVRRALELYASCRLVVTSRLHCALPCLAMGTPVVVVEPRFETERFSGYEPFIDIGKSNLPFDLGWEARPAETIHSLRERLTKTASEMVAAALGR